MCGKRPHKVLSRVDVDSLLRLAHSASCHAQRLKAADLLERAIDLVLVFQLQLSHREIENDIVSFMAM